jgi:hypothetical protein
MKRLCFVLFYLVFGLYAGNAAPDMREIIKLCPDPDMIKRYIKDSQREFHSFVSTKVSLPIKEVFIPETEFDVHPFVNNQGTLICSYAPRGTKVALFHINMGPIKAPLGNINQPAGEIKPAGR